LPELAEVEAAATAAASETELFKAIVDQGLFDSEQRLVDRYLRAGDRLLDIGCGAGREAFGFARLGIHVAGIDLCADLIAWARQRAATMPLAGDVSFRTLPLSRLDFPPAAFDVVYFSSDVYACLPGRRNRVAVLRTCSRLTRPGGLIIFPVTVQSSPLDRWLVDNWRRLAGGGFASLELLNQATARFATRPNSPRSIAITSARRARCFPRFARPA
jgi:SAM-dependent methyltransferase